MNFRKIYNSLQEDKADDQFQQIYDDLTDAHGYLSDPENSRQYQKMGWEVEDIKNRFEKYYDFKNILKESMSEEDEKKCFENWNPLERDWVVCPNPDDYDSMLHEYAKKWLGQFDLDEDTTNKITNAISNAFWNGNSRGFANAKESFSGLSE